MLYIAMMRNFSEMLQMFIYYHPSNHGVYKRYPLNPLKLSFRFAAYVALPYSMLSLAILAASWLMLTRPDLVAALLWLGAACFAPFAVIYGVTTVMGSFLLFTCFLMRIEVEDFHLGSALLCSVVTWFPFVGVTVFYYGLRYSAAQLTLYNYYLVYPIMWFHTIGPFLMMLSFYYGLYMMLVGIREVTETNIFKSLVMLIGALLSAFIFFYIRERML